MPKLNLEADYRAQVQAILKHWAPQYEVWAYGSRVNGTCHEASDLDLVLRDPNTLKKPIETLSRLKQAFKESDLPIIVDLIDWATLPDSFRIEIEKQYIVIQPKPC